MRNLKRVLSLALAMIMVLGLMVISSSAAGTSDFVDADKITYTEAVDVLGALGVVEGSDGVLNPTAILTREQAAKIICYLVLGADAAEQVAKVPVVTFNDVELDRWSAGFISYCANTGYIAGDGTGNFNPNGKINGIGFAKLLLVALGYDAEAEGYINSKDWATNVAVDATEAGLTLNGVALYDKLTREQAFQMALQALQADTVEYVKGTVIGLVGPYTVERKETGYRAEGVNYAGSDTNAPGLGTLQLCEKLYPELKLTAAGNESTWGRPYDYQWTYGTGAKLKTVYTAWEAPLNTHVVATTECEIAEDLGLKKGSKKVAIFDNGVQTFTGYSIDSTDTKTTLGAQGTLIEVYSDCLVIIDTYLAQVTKVNEAAYDKAGHLKTPAHSDLAVYDLPVVASGVTQDSDIDSIDYAKGDYILVNYNEAANELSLIEENIPGIDTSLAPSFDGKQTKIWYTSPRHTVDKDDYEDADHFVLNVNSEDRATRTWFKDQYGNLIGSIAINNIGYAVLKDIIWDNQDAYATLVLFDESEETVKVNKFDGLNAKDASDGWALDEDYNDRAPTLDDDALNDQFPGVSRLAKYNTEYLGYALYKVTYNENGSVDLQGYDYDAGKKSGTEIIGHAKDVTLISTSRQFIDDGSSKVYVTADTEILVREKVGSSYEYVAYNIDNLPEFVAGTVELFYTADKYDIAERIYVKDYSLVTDFGSHLFFQNKSSVYNDLQGNVHFTAIVDGEEREVVTSKTIYARLSDDLNKLFHAAWDTDPTSRTYGQLTGIYLVNEAKDDIDGSAARSGCDYLYGTITVSGKTIINDGNSYTVDDNTVLIGVKSVDQIDTAKNGVWVVVSQDWRGVQYVDAVYVGEKLNADVKVSVSAVKSGTTLANIAEVKDASGKITGYTVTLPAGVSAADITIASAEENTVIADSSAAEREKLTISNQGAGSVNVTVTAEDGKTTASYTIEVKAADPVATLWTSDWTWTINGTQVSAPVGYTDSNLTRALAAAINNPNVVSRSQVNVSANNNPVVVTVGGAGSYPTMTSYDNASTALAAAASYTLTSTSGTQATGTYSVSVDNIIVNVDVAYGTYYCSALKIVA